MTNNLRYKTLMGIATVAGIGLLTITAIPSRAYHLDEVKENLFSQSQNISNWNLNSSAVKLTNEKTFFMRSPRLIDTAATHKNRNNSFATYYFTIKVPSDAGAALKAIQIKQRKNFDEMITFKPQENRAAMGETFAKEKSLALAAVGGEQEPDGTVTVVLAQPVQPGNTVTIGVKPKHNPSMGGVYLFGVTAYPEGENSQGLYLGAGRFHISHE